MLTPNNLTFGFIFHHPTQQPVVVSGTFITHSLMHVCVEIASSVFCVKTPRVCSDPVLRRHIRHAGLGFVHFQKLNVDFQSGITFCISDS